MQYLLSNRVQQVKPSPTLAVSAKAAELKRQGIDVIGLGAGEPDFDTPAEIKNKAIEAIQNGFTKYTAVEGTITLREAICEKFKNENNLSYTPKQILVSSGGKQSFYNLTQAFLNAGDEVIIPAPYWVSYPDMVLLAEGVPVIIPTTFENRFKLTPDALEAAITPKTKLFVINSPSNPTGMAYTHAELKQLGEVLKRHPHVFVATDDMYEHILWSAEPFANILNLCPELYDRTFVLNGVSKAYSMTGWRIGYAAGPEPVIKAMGTIQGQSTSNPNSIAQVAAETALRGSQDCVREMCKAFYRRHQQLVEGLNSLPGFECAYGDGTFYAFPNVKLAIEALQLENDLAFSNFLLEKARVAVVPGSAFGAEGFIRLSFAASEALLTKAVERIAEIL